MLVGGCLGRYKIITHDGVGLCCDNNKFQCFYSLAVREFISWSHGVALSLAMLSTKLPASNSCRIHAALASDCTISPMSFMVTFNIGETHSYIKFHNRNVEQIPRAFIIYSYVPTLTKMSRNIVYYTKICNILSLTKSKVDG